MAVLMCLPVSAVAQRTPSSRAATDRDPQVAAALKEVSAEQIRPEEDVEDLRKAFEDPSNYRSRIWRHRKKSGDVIPVKITSFNLDFGGRRARLGVIEDLTERMLAEERARQSEERYRDLLASQGSSGKG